MVCYSLSPNLFYPIVKKRRNTEANVQVEKYDQGHFGACPRVFCHATHVLPCGRADIPGLDTIKLYCPNCGDIYSPPSSKYASVDGESFFSHLIPSYSALAPCFRLWRLTQMSLLSIARLASPDARRLIYRRILRNYVCTPILPDIPRTPLCTLQPNSPKRYSTPILFPTHLPISIANTNRR